MKKYALVISVVIATSVCLQTTAAQITINLPKLPKVGKQKPDRPSTDTTTTGRSDNGISSNGLTKTRSKLIYDPQRPNGTPILMKNSVYVQAKTHDEYWKMPGQLYSSWVPALRFNSFYNNEKSLNYTVAYFNPDGSPWYSEKLEQGNLAGDRTVMFQSPSPYGGVFDTKSTIGIGLYSFKITDADKNEVIFEGKFKVGKFGKTSNPRERNKVDFFVDHDWLMPFAMVGFHHALDEVGAMPPLVSVWMKGAVESSELEGRIFYKGQQIASTRDNDGSSGVSDYDERMSEYAPAFAPQNRWKRWQFQWGNVLFDNNGTFNRANFPKAHYVDKNPGDYLVKIFRNGEQVRELSFTVGTDGRIVVPAYMSQVFIPYYGVILPVKVLGTAEKWNVAAWKTEAFYGNALSGFTGQ